MEDYKRWAKNDMGISLLDDLHIRELPGDERGIFCQQPVPANSVLISIPFDSLLSSRSVRDSPLKKLADMDLREDDLLSVMLLHEVHENKEQSRWYHHLQLIPPTYHSIINYSAEELELIKGTNLYQTAHAWQTQVRGDFALLLLELRRSELDLFSVEGEGGFLWFTYENYLWALCTIWSRFVTVEMEEDAPASLPSTVLMFAPSPPKKTVVQRCMVPYFDMLNHNPTAQVSHYSDLKDKKLILYTAQSFSASDELYLNYGAASNSRLLMLYGFVIAPTIESDGEVKKVVGNPHDSVDLYAPMQPGVNSYNAKSSILSEWSVNHLSEPFKILPITGTQTYSCW
jgi:histone-lysine N-methyltransferase SETD3